MARAALAATALLASGASAEAPAALDAECARVAKVYPLLMLAVMAEGPMNCGTHTGEEIDCDAGETPEQAAARAARLERRQLQEEAYKKADEACTAWRANKRSEPLIDAVFQAVAEARKTDKG